MALGQFSQGHTLPGVFHAHMLLWPLLRAAVPLCAALAVLFWARSLVRFLPVLMALDVALVGLGRIRTGSPLTDAPAPIGNVQAHSGDAAPIVCHSIDLAGLEFASDENSRASSQDRFMYQLGVPNLNACAGVAAGVPYSLLQSDISEALGRGVDDGRVSAARALGCTHMVLLAPPVDESCPEEWVPAISNLADATGRRILRVMRVPDPVPPVFVIREPRWAAHPEEALASIMTAHSADAVTRVLEDPLGRAPGRALPESHGVRARVLGSRRDRMTLEMTGQGGAVLGVRTVFLVGWGATQGGRELPVLRSGGQHVAVMVEDVSKGSVELEYRPPGLLKGLAYSFTGFLLMGLWPLVLQRPWRITGRAR
jgi:hypothetical protein